MNRFFIVSLILSIIALNLAQSIFSFAQSSLDIAEVQRFELAYLQKVDDGNVKGQLEMVSRDAAVSSIINGEIWRGWDSIMLQAEAFAPMAKKVRTIVDTLNVIPLGNDIAIVVMEVHSMKRDPADNSIPDMRGVMTHVLKKTSEGWRMLHEHFSTKLTPEFIDFMTAAMKAQQK